MKTHIFPAISQWQWRLGDVLHLRYRFFLMFFFLKRVSNLFFLLFQLFFLLFKLFFFSFSRRSRVQFLKNSFFMGFLTGKGENQGSGAVEIKHRGKGGKTNRVDSIFDDFFDHLVLVVEGIPGAGGFCLGGGFSRKGKSNRRRLSNHIGGDDGISLASSSGGGFSRRRSRSTGISLKWRVLNWNGVKIRESNYEKNEKLILLVIYRVAGTQTIS